MYNWLKDQNQRFFENIFLHFIGGPFTSLFKKSIYFSVVSPNWQDFSDFRAPVWVLSINHTQRKRSPRLNSYSFQKQTFESFSSSFENIVLETWNSHKCWFLPRLLVAIFLLRWLWFFISSERPFGSLTPSSKRSFVFSIISDSSTSTFFYTDSNSNGAVNSKTK